MSGMTRHRDEVELHRRARRLQDFDALKKRLSRAREKDTTLDYAERRGLELDRERTPFDLRREAERELERKTELLRERPELAFGRDPFASPEQERTIKVFELGRELERQLPEFDRRVAEKERERNDWLERSLGEQGGHFRDWAIPERELQQAARELIGGVALERAERELTHARERHAEAERELSHHRWETSYRRGLERVVHALGDLNREKQLATRERQAALELDQARERCASVERWLEEPAQRNLIGERAGELRQHDQQLLRELQRERGEREQVREMRQELTRCPQQERALELSGRSLEFRELQRDAGLQRDLGQMREQRLAREQELARGREIERRGITPLREFQRDPQYGRDRDRADNAWARHAAEKGLGMEQIRDELVKDRQRSYQLVQERELERLAQLAEREVKRARGLERDRGIGWSR